MVVATDQSRILWAEASITNAVQHQFDHLDTNVYSATYRPSGASRQKLRSTRSSGLGALGSLIVERLTLPRTAPAGRSWFKVSQTHRTP